MISLPPAPLQTGSRVPAACPEPRAAAPPPPPGGAAPAMTAAARDLAAVMAQADTGAIGAMQGRSDTQALVQSIAQAQVALETAVAIRDKVVEAYQEILRMPV